MRMEKRRRGSFTKLSMANQLELNWLAEQLQSEPDIGSQLAEEIFKTAEPEQENTGNTFS